MSECPLVEPPKKKRATILESFNRRMKVLAFMIQAGRPVTPTEINDATGIDHYPTINYHINTLRKEGVVVLIENSENKYQVQPMLFSPDVLAKISGIIDEALPTVTLNPAEVEGDMQDAKISALTNSFLYYVKYLSESGLLKH